jgi:hypothetical protein
MNVEDTGSELDSSSTGHRPVVGSGDMIIKFRIPQKAASILTRSPTVSFSRTAAWISQILQLQMTF